MQSLAIEEVASPSNYANAYPLHLRLVWTTAGLPATGFDAKACVSAVKGTFDPRSELYLDLRTANDGASFSAAHANWTFLPRLSYDNYNNGSTSMAFQHCATLDPASDLYYDANNVRQIRNADISVYQFTLPGAMLTRDDPKLVFDLRNAANPLAANADTADFASITVAIGNLRSASGRRSNVFTYASMEVLQFLLSPNFYARTDATLELTVRIRGLKQKKQLSANSWFSLDAPEGFRFHTLSRIKIFRPDFSADDFNVLFTDCGRIGSVCVGSYLGAQLGDVYEYNNQNWEEALWSMFKNSPHVDAAKYLKFYDTCADSANATCFAAESGGDHANVHFVLGPEAGNNVIEYVADPLSSLTMQDRSKWALVPTRTRYEPAVVTNGNLQFSVDDTVLLKLKITGMETPAKTAARATTRPTWTFRYGLIQDKTLDKILTMATVKPRDGMLEDVAVSTGVRGFTPATVAGSLYTIATAPYASFVQVVFSISGSEVDTALAAAGGGTAMFFYLWTPAVAESANTWTFANTDCRGDLGTVRCFVVDHTTAASGSLALTLAQTQFTVFGEAALGVNSAEGNTGTARQLSLFARTPSFGYDGSTSPNWRLLLSTDAAMFERVRQNMQGETSSLQLREVLDFNAVNLNFVLAQASFAAPALDLMPDFAVSAIPAILGRASIVEFTINLRKIYMVNTPEVATSREPRLSSVRISGPCKVISYKDGTTLQRLTSGVQADGTAVVPLGNMKLSSARIARVPVEVEVCAGGAFSPANRPPPTVGVQGLPVTDGENLWTVEALGIPIGASSADPIVLDFGTLPHFATATHDWDRRSAFAAISQDRVLFNVYLPDTASLDGAMTFSIVIKGMTLASAFGCTLFRVPGSVATFPSNDVGANAELHECGVLATNGMNTLTIRSIPVTRPVLTFMVRAVLPTASDGSVEIFEVVTRTNATTGAAVTTTTLRQHNALRLNLGPTTSGRYSQCGSQVSVLSSVVDPLTVSEAALLQSEPPTYPARHALGEYFNQLHSSNRRVRMKTIPSLDNVYVLQDDESQEFLLWSPLEPTDNVWLLGGILLSTISVSCVGLATENANLYGDLDDDTLREKSQELWSLILMVVLAFVGILFSAVCVYNLTFHRDDCLSRLKLILVLRYGWSGNLLTKNYYDHYGDDVGDDVALTYPSYWVIADERKVAKMRHKEHNMPAIKEGGETSGKSSWKNGQQKSSQDWPSRDDYYVPALPVGMDVYDMPSSGRNDPGSPTSGNKSRNNSLAIDVPGGASAGELPMPSPSSVTSDYKRNHSKSKHEPTPARRSFSNGRQSSQGGNSSARDSFGSQNSLPTPVDHTPSVSSHFTPSPHKHSSSNPNFPPRGCRFHICEPPVVEGVQRMLDETWKSTSTRDRRRLAARIGGSARIPTRLEVGFVARVENTHLWERYAKLRSSMLQLAKGPDLKIPPHKPTPLSTRSWEAAGLPQPELFSPLNEFLFFHGTSPSAADSIANEGFRIAYAGKHGGSMYGAGIYASESCTKADEYSHDEWLEDDRYCAMLVVRAIAARVYYTADPRPDGQYIETLCKFNRFDSVLGDREKARDTFKEWVFFKPEQVYTEYIIRYKRRFDVRPPSYGAKLLHGVSYRNLVGPVAQLGKTIGNTLQNSSSGEWGDAGGRIKALVAGGKGGRGKSSDANAAGSKYEKRSSSSLPGAGGDRNKVYPTSSFDSESVDKNGKSEKKKKSAPGTPAESERQMKEKVSAVAPPVHSTQQIREKASSTKHADFADQKVSTRAVNEEKNASASNVHQQNLIIMRVHVR
eukprot:g9493.t1